MKANLLTIGTEIVNGEVVNSNAAWISTQLETMNIRVLRHLTVRDHRDEVMAGLRFLTLDQDEILIVTGGLGPTSDDLTRALVAEFTGRNLEFDDQVFSDLARLYEKRGLPLREAHRHQCWFPKGSERLSNPVGTALGFYLKGSPHIFVLPGPPRELEGMWREGVLPRLKPMVPPTAYQWHRWTYFGVPESEVAEVVEKVIAGHDLEVGYRAQVPYVRVKLFADPKKDRDVLSAMEGILSHAFVGHGDVDLAEMLVSRWPAGEIEVYDGISDSLLLSRLFQAARSLKSSKKTSPQIKVVGSESAVRQGLSLSSAGEEFKVTVRAGEIQQNFKQALPYKTPLDSERGRKAAAEWALWLTFGALKNRPPKS